MAGIQCFTPPKWGTVGQAMRAMGKREESRSSHSVGIETSGPRPRQAATMRAPACARPPAMATRMAAGTVSAVTTRG